MHRVSAGRQALQKESDTAAACQQCAAAIHLPAASSTGVGMHAAVRLHLLHLLHLLVAQMLLLQSAVLSVSCGLHCMILALCFLQGAA